MVAALIDQLKLIYLSLFRLYIHRRYKLSYKAKKVKGKK